MMFVSIFQNADHRLVNFRNILYNRKPQKSAFPVGQKATGQFAFQFLR